MLEPGEGKKNEREKSLLNQSTNDTYQFVVCSLSIDKSLAIRYLSRYACHDMYPKIVQKTKFHYFFLNHDLKN